MQPSNDNDDNNDNDNDNEDEDMPRLVNDYNNESILDQ